MNENHNPDHINALLTDASLDDLHQYMMVIGKAVKNCYLALSDGNITNSEKINRQSEIQQWQALKHRCLNLITTLTIDRDHTAAVKLAEIEINRQRRRQQNNREILMMKKFMDLAKDRIDHKTYNDILSLSKQTINF